MSKNGKEVYISYAWGGESERIANELDADLEASGIKIIRDKRDLGYKGAISEFMQEIGRGHAIIVIISDKYLKSSNCMYEMVEISKNKDIHDRIFPIVLSDANIYDPVNRINYIKHWENKLKELDEAVRSVSSANLQGIRGEIDSYDEIRDNISQLTYLFKDMNTLTPEMHEGSDFAGLIAALNRRLEEDDVSHSSAPASVRPKAAPEPKEKIEPQSSGSVDDYLHEVSDRLLRDDYRELADRRFGNLRFDKVFDRKDKYLAVLAEYHRFVFLSEDVLDETRLVELGKEIMDYCFGEYNKTASYVYTFGVILTNSISEELKAFIHKAEPMAETKTDDLSISSFVVYCAAEDEIYYPKLITEDFNSDFSGKIKKYLWP